MFILQEKGKKKIKEERAKILCNFYLSHGKKIFFKPITNVKRDKYYFLNLKFLYVISLNFKENKLLTYMYYSFNLSLKNSLIYI